MRAGRGAFQRRLSSSDDCHFAHLCLEKSRTSEISFEAPAAIA